MGLMGKEENKEMLATEVGKRGAPMSKAKIDMLTQKRKPHRFQFSQKKKQQQQQTTGT